MHTHNECFSYVCPCLPHKSHTCEVRMPISNRSRHLPFICLFPSCDKSIDAPRKLSLGSPGLWASSNGPLQRRDIRTRSIHLMAFPEGSINRAYACKTKDTKSRSRPRNPHQCPTFYVMKSGMGDAVRMKSCQV